ncbi:hypothetical protein D3C77_808710 [compost metagenome]
MMGVVLCVAVLFLAAQIESYVAGCATAGDVFDGVFVTGFMGLVFYVAGKW